MSSMADRIRRARRLVSVSQAELARRVGVQRSAVSQWERCGGTVPSVGHLALVASETGVAFEWLATGRGRMQLDAVDEMAATPSACEHDDLEHQMIVALRRLNGRRREAVALLVELLS